MHSRDLRSTLVRRRAIAPLDYCESVLTFLSYAPSKPPSAGTAIDPLPARALHADLLDRFKSLTGSSGASACDDAILAKSKSEGDKSEDDKTIEELLADLGPSEQWSVGKTEHDEVEELLRAADTALKEQSSLETVPDDEEHSHKPAPARLPAVDVSVFSPEPESDEDEEPEKTKAQVRDNVNQEADDVLKRLMDEVKYEKEHVADGEEEVSAGSSDDGEEAIDPSLDLPAVPSKDLPDAPKPATPSAEQDLAARFASLTLPSAPTLLTSSSSKKSKTSAQKFADDEIDSWCIICNDDATLSCTGCDGDLYCTNCWLEGHRGEDAGYEERTHKAVQYVKGGGKKRQKNRRVMVGA